MSSPAPGNAPPTSTTPAPTTSPSPPIISTPPVAILSPPPAASSSPPPSQPPPQTAPPPAASSPPPPAAQSPPPPAQSAPPPAESSPPPPVATSPPPPTAPPASPPPVAAAPPRAPPANPAPAQSPPPPSDSSPPPTTAVSPPPPSDAGSSPPPPSDAGSSPPPPSNADTSPPPPSDSGSSPPPDSSPSPPQSTSSSPPPPSKKKSPPADASPPPPLTARPPLEAPPTNAPPTVLSPPAPAPPVTSTSPTPPSNTTSPSLVLPGTPPSPSVPSNGVPSPPSPGEPESHSSAVSSTTVIGIAVGGIAILAVIALVILCFARKRSRGSKHGNSQDFRTAPSFYNKDAYYDSERGARFDSGYSTSSDVLGKPFFPPAPPPSSMGHAPTVRGQGSNNSSFSYEELAQATSGFSRANMLGEGGFGCVYKGVLSGGQEVAVKQLKVGGGQGEREFRAEVEIITRIHHRHLVTLVGYCIAETQRLLVYEFVPNGTLEHHLHGKGKPMDWSMRMKIAVGSARGLAYLHEDCHPKIIHRDIKSSNILLDNNFEAQVADFGLAKLASDTHTHVTTRVMGTFGYLAPEYASSGKLTDKSDVYSFGVVLLELITGRKPVDTSQPLGEESLVEWSRPLISQALETGNLDCLADPLLSEYNKEEMHRMIRAAGASVRHAGNKRPKMSQVVRLLESDDSDSRPGFSGLHDSPFASQDYDSAQYSSDIRRFRKMALGTSQEYGSDYSGATSDYGVNPSVSSGEFQSKEWTGRQTPQGHESEWPLRSRQM